MKKHFLKFSIVFILAYFAICNLLVGQNDIEAKWGKSIAKYEQNDSVLMPEPEGILLLGSSSFTIWKDVRDYFPGKNIINRRFGGSQMSDVLYFKERLVLPYKPRQIVIYEGENDIAAGEKPDSVFTELVQIVNWARKQLPGVKFSLISMKPSPRRWDFRETMLEMNQKLKQYADENEDIDFINIWDLLLGSDGNPVKENYLDDLLHLNATGYKIWQTAIKPFLK